jgi:hypothetical protein
VEVKAKDRARAKEKAKMVKVARAAKAATRVETRIKKLVPMVKNPFAPMAQQKRRRFHVPKRLSPYVLMELF